MRTTRKVGPGIQLVMRPHTLCAMPSSEAVSRPAGQAVLTFLTVLLVLSWLATPVLAYGGMITGAPFFGELPSPQERAESTRLWVLAGFTAFGAPALAAVTARRSRPLRTVALVELGISVAVTVALMLATG
jgi:hypothetical protein